MNDLYWITRCNPIHNTALTFLIIGLVAIVLLIIAYVSCLEERETSVLKSIKKLLKIFVSITSVSLITQLLVPTTKEAFLIYGVGGSIDYLKSNPTAKQLPDKCMKALDKWVDSWIVEDSVKNKK